MDCTPSALVQSSREAARLSPDRHLSVQTYLLYLKSGLSMTVSELIAAAKCYVCLQGMQLAAQTYLLCQIAQSTPVTPPSEIILQDALGQFWKLIVDPLGLVGSESNAGPKTSDVILQDSSGGFWKLIVNTDGLIGTESNAGPATIAPELDDGTGTLWTLVVDTDGNLGATS